MTPAEKGFEDGLIRSIEVFFGLEPGGMPAVPPPR